MKLPNPFKKKPKVWADLQSGTRVEPAFVSGGIQYYYVKDTFNTFAGRALEALAVYEKWNMRCSREYLLAHVEAVNKVLNSPKSINLTEIMKLNANLSERLSFAMPTEDIIWEFAAVAFFDDTESPYHYDPAYGKEKIKRWKAAGDVKDFFSSAPIGELIPLPDFSAVDLGSYLTTLNLIGTKHIDSLLSALSSGQQKQDLKQALLSQKSMLQVQTD